jgi:hypothetical protein
MSEEAAEVVVRNKPGPKPRTASAAGLSVDEAQREGVVMGDSRDPNTEVQQARVRVPMNAGQKLSLRGIKLDKENFHYKWMYEGPDRLGVLAAAKDAFYEHVKDDQGHNMIAPSGSGHQYLMQLPKEYWREDMQASKEKRMALRKRNNAIKPNEYTVDAQGRAVTHGEVNVSRKSSNNPYSA